MQGAPSAPMRRGLPALLMVASACGAASLAPAARRTPAPQEIPPVPAPSAAPAPQASCPAPPAAKRERHGSISLDGRWLIEAVDNDDTRVWEIQPDHVVLRFVIAASGDADDGVRNLDHDRLAVPLKTGLVLVDRTTGALHEFPGAGFLAESDKYLLLADDRHVVRLRQANLAAAGAVELADRPSRADAVGDGEAFVVDGALVHFGPDKVIRSGVEFGGLRPDGARLLACDPDRKQIEAVDTTTGAVDDGFPVARGACTGEYRASPAYAPDPRYVFWFERGPGARGYDTTVVVAVADTKTRAIQRLRDVQSTWSISFAASAYVGADGRLCGRFYGFHSSFTQCDWKLGAHGRPLRDPQPKRQPQPSLAALGLDGAIEITRVPSPAGDRTAVLTYRKQGDDVKSDLRLVVVGAAGKAERSIALRSGVVQFDDATVGADYDPAPGTYSPPPQILFADASHAMVLPGLGDLPVFDVDLATGTFTTPCAHSESCSVAGRYVLLDGGKLLDLADGHALELDATPEAWTAAVHVPACP